MTHAPPGWLPEALLPRTVCLQEDALHHVAGDSHPLAVVGHEVDKVKLGMVNFVVGVVLDLLDRPVPQSSEVPKPLVQSGFLALRGSQLESPDDHFFTISLPRPCRPRF